MFRCLIYCYLAFAVQLINLSGKGVLIIFLVTWQTTETCARMGNRSCGFTALLLMVPQGKNIHKCRKCLQGESVFLIIVLDVSYCAEIRE